MGKENLNCRKWGKMLALTVLYLCLILLPQGKVEMAIELLSKDEAEAKPAGKGRDEPNQNPTLEEPK